jgi:lysophospholipase L1-like esterase
MMKRVISLMVCCLLCLSLFCGCGKNQAETPAVEDPAANVQADAPAQEPVADEPFGFDKERIVLVTEGEKWILYDGAVPYGDVTWITEDPSVATFENGVVTALSTGETMVHAEYMGQTYSCRVVCNIRFFEGESVEPTDADDYGGPYGQDNRDPVMPPPQTARVDSAFFDDAVFVGDSVTLKLSYYAASSGKLGKAQFLTRGSYSVAHAVMDTMLLTYQGKDMAIEEAIKATGAKKVFLMMGMNDIGLYGIDATISNWGKMIERIRSNCPDVTVYIQSMTPIWTGGEKGDLNNTNMDLYNSKLKTFAAENDIEFIDVAPYMKDSTGGIATRYCSDQYVHVTDLGAAAWIRVLKAYNY